MSYYYQYNSLIGTICIKEKNEKITNVLFQKELLDESLYIETKKETELMRETYQQLNDYFNKKRKTFDIPLALEGTQFQIKVWKALMDIPYGETKTYQEIAKAIGNEKACRAVGGANNKNPIPIIVPCHRVIGSNGKLVGYAGGLDIKMKLLELEGE